MAFNPRLGGLAEGWAGMVSEEGAEVDVANGSLKQGQPAKTVDPVAGKTVAEILGEIVWLMTQDPTGREMKVGEIEGLVMPAILQKRFHIKYAQVPDMGRPGAMTLQPVEVEIYAPSLQTVSSGPTPAVLAVYSVRRADGKGRPEQ